MSQKASRCEHPGLKSDLMSAISRFLKKASDKSRSPSPCAITSSLAFKEHPQVSGSTDPAREEPQTLSAGEKPWLTCICLWRWEGRAGSVPGCQSFKQQGGMLGDLLPGGRHVAAGDQTRSHLLFPHGVRDTCQGFPTPPWAFAWAGASLTLRSRRTTAWHVLLEASLVP